MPRNPSIEFESVLPRLVTAYERGRLVPFTGAGMSLPVCTAWSEFVMRLETQAGVRLAQRRRRPRPDDIIRRANRAVRLLKSRDPDVFPRAMREALPSTPNGRRPKPPPQTRALAALWWPLVLSTNYDNCFVSAFREHFELGNLRVLGRSPADCQRVLHCLSSPETPILWTLQGFLNTPCRAELDDVAHLSDELVVGHDEYRRVTYRDIHFRRAFAEVFRSRSLLFLGSGIRETYLQELFGEVFENYGPSSQQHYAFMPRGEVDVDFMLARFQITVVEYPKGRHEEVRKMLRRLRAEVEKRSHRATQWSWGRAARDRLVDTITDLDVVRGPLGPEHNAGECLIVSSGGKGRHFVHSASIRTVLERRGVDLSKGRKIGTYTARYAKDHVYSVRARSQDDERGLEHIYRATLEVLDLASRRYKSARMQLLAAGGTMREAGGDADWRSRTFPEHYSFVQIVRAWAAWRTANPRRKFRLALHLVTPAVHMEIASGRLDVLELIKCTDVRFWAEILGANGSCERRLFQRSADTRLADIVHAMNLHKSGWMVDVIPTPNLLHLTDADRAVEHLLQKDLDALGVVPGSTLLFQRA